MDDANAALTAMGTATKNVPKAGKAAAGVSAALKTTTESFRKLAADLKLEADALVAAGATCFFGLACFAAGTPLRTPWGAMNIQDVRVGDTVLSRDEYDPTGAVVGKVVEEVFVRLASVWELLIGGRVIGTSGEHPFYAWEKGWVAARELSAGDTLLCEDGVWRCVDGVRDTGEWQTVYNLRVADYHTYFVGAEEWGFAVWAHNAYAFRSLNDNDISAVLEGGGISRSGRGGQEAMADLIGYDKQDTKYMSVTEDFDVVMKLGDPNNYIKFDTKKVNYISMDELLNSSGYKQFRSFMDKRLYFVSQQKHGLVVGAIPRSAMVKIVLYGTDVEV